MAPSCLRGSWFVFQNPEDQIICSVVKIVFGLENPVPSIRITPLVEEQITFGTSLKLASQKICRCSRWPAVARGPSSGALQ